MRVLRLAVGRLLAAAASAGAVLVLGFVIFRVLPGDPVRSMTRDRPVTPDELASLRASLGVDQPVSRQFLTYLTNVLHGDLGESFTFHRPVTEVLAERLPATILLALSATLLSAAAGFWIGTHAGWRPGGRVDRAATGIGLVLWSMPVFWLGLGLMVLLSVGAGLFPTGGMRTPGVPAGSLAGVADVADHLVLPCLTLVLAQFAQYAAAGRAAVLGQLGSDYLLLARAKGLRDAQVRRRHAVPNALLPVTAMTFTHLGYVVAGVVTVESVFSWPGLGSLVFEATSVPDLPLLQGAFLLVAGGAVVANTLGDGVYRLLDPRLRGS
jgi:peptide/nickel transport system permease protein